MIGLLRHVAAIMALPFVVLVVVPALLVTQTRSAAPGWTLPFPLNLLPVVLGIALIACGLTLLILTIRLFMTVGQGTLAPWDATQRLVVRGVYRHVRNPMISGVLCVLMGEAALLGSLPMLAWALLAIGVNVVYMPLVEEPGLQARFGDDYATYACHVPRWIPRRSAWLPESE